MEPIARIYQYQKGNQDNLDVRQNSHCPSIIVLREQENLRNTYGATKCKELSVTEYINRMKGVDGIVKPILLQITYAMKRVHEHGSVLTEDAFNLDNFRFSEDWEELVWIVKPTDIETSSDGEKKQENFSWLEGLFQTIIGLANGTNEKFTSKNLMEKNFSSTDTIVKHPYFWTPTKIVQFLSTANQIYWLLLETKGSDGVEGLLSQYDGWKQMLHLAHHPKVDYDPRAIEKLAQGENNGPWLLRFFRNRAAHYWDKDTRSELGREIFKTQYNGFWKFFDTQFPELLVTVYEWALKDDNAKIMIQPCLDAIQPAKEIIPMQGPAGND